MPATAVRRSQGGSRGPLPGNATAGAPVVGQSHHGRSQEPGERRITRRRDAARTGQTRWTTATGASLSTPGMSYWPGPGTAVCHAAQPASQGAFCHDRPPTAARRVRERCSGTPGGLFPQAVDVRLRPCRRCMPALPRSLRPPFQLCARLPLRRCNQCACAFNRRPTKPNTKTTHPLRAACGRGPTHERPAAMRHSGE